MLLSQTQTFQDLVAHPLPTDPECLACGFDAHVRFIDCRVEDISYWCDNCFELFEQISAFGIYIYRSNLRTHKEILKKMMQDRITGVQNV